MQGWSAQSPRPPAPCFSGSKAGSFEHSLIDPEPRIALEAHDPLVEVGRQPIGRKAADVQCALDAALAREAARTEGHTSALQSPMRISYAVYCWKNQKTLNITTISKAVLAT